jgi:diguanylate cyclase (GGDEF)-like protein
LESFIQPTVPWLRICKGLLWPTLLPIVVVGVWVNSPWALVDAHPSFSAVFVVLWITSVVLGWRLHRTRIVFAACSLGVLVQGASMPGLSSQLPAMQMATSLFLAVALLIFGFTGDRRISTPSGVFRVTVVVCAAGLTAWMCLPEQGSLIANLYRPMFDSPTVSGMAVPQLALVLATAASLGLSIQYVEKQGAIESAMIGALIAGECGIWSGLTTPTAMVWFVTAQLILVLGLMEGFHSMAYQDELTALKGRRALNELMDQLPANFAICMVDIDHFKKFNDKYGHDAGDEVLRMVAGQLGQVGVGGRAFRFGGEEFTLVFPGKSSERVEEELDSLRKAIAARPFVFRGKERPEEKPDKPNTPKTPRKTATVTVSMGLAECKSGKKKPSRVLKEADQNLYRAKEAGRNKLIW